MPREIVSHTAPKDSSVTEWVPGNYTDGRAVVYDIVGERDEEDFTYRVKEFVDDYQPARHLSEHVMLLGLPIVLDEFTMKLKKSEDELFCREKSGKPSDPNWSHCVHADYSRADDFMFSATTPGQDFELQLSGAISVLEIMKYYNDAVPAVKHLNRRVFGLRQATGSLQKYIACIILDKDFTPDELMTIVETAITRKKYSKDDLASTAAMLILLPLVRQLFQGTQTPTAEDRQSAVPRIHKEFKATLATFKMLSRSDGGWRDAKVCVSPINHPQWIETACQLAANFGVTQTHVEMIRRNMQRPCSSRSPIRSSWTQRHPKSSLTATSVALNESWTHHTFIAAPRLARKACW